MIDKIKQILINITKKDERQIEELVKSESLSFLDSLQFLNFIVELEEVFEISIEPDELLNLTDINSVINLIEIKL